VEKKILKDLNFTVEQGQILAVMGLSGSGKSTLCLCLGGIIPHYLGGEMSGQVLINGQDTAECKIARLALEVGIVFQDADTQLFSPTVEDEIAFAPENLCLPSDQIRQRVDAVFDMMGINHLRYENTNNLSGGQKHLVAMAAVLAMDPAILVLDEVLVQLDAIVKENVIDILLELRRRGKTIIIVEHDLEAVTIADRVLLLEDGMLVNDGPASILQDKELLARYKLVI